jgi:N-acylneuraminate cytidylyltransferase
MKTVAIITARSGSKRIPGKNIKLFAGKPLIYWTIEAAKYAPMIDKIVVSTDSYEIAGIACKLGADIPFIRPECLAEDTTSHIDVVLHAIGEIDYNNYTHCCLLQPTSPLRTADDIDGALILAAKTKSKSVVSVTEDYSYPFIAKRWFSKYLVRPHWLKKRYLPQQKIQPRYFINGAIYINTIEHLFEEQSFYSQFMRGYGMPPERSLQIDSQLDFDIAEYLMIRRIDANNQETKTLPSDTQIQTDIVL